MSAYVERRGGSRRRTKAAALTHGVGTMLGLVLASRLAEAQASTPTDALAARPRTDDEVVSLVLASGGETRLTLGGYLQVDGRWISGAGGADADGLLLRRARLMFDVSRADGFHLRLQPDFGQGRVLVQDAFAGYQRAGTTVRVGRFRPAFGAERMQSSATLLAPERGLVNSLMPSRSLGVQLQRAWRAWRLDVGGFRTPVGSDASAFDTDGDVNARSGAGHDVLIRLGGQWRRAGRYVDAQAGVLLGRERGTPDAPGLVRLLSVGQQPLLTFASDESSTAAAVAAGARARATVGAVGGTKTFMAAVEGAWFEQRVQRGSMAARPQVAAATARLARVWNGERLASQDIRPGPRGAIDVGVRAGVLGVWGQGLEDVVTRRSVTHAHSAGVAVSWVPNRTTRLSVGYDVTARGGLFPREHAVVARWQQGF